MERDDFRIQVEDDGSAQHGVIRKLIYLIFTLFSKQGPEFPLILSL